MYVTSWEKNSVSKNANCFQKGIVDSWYTGEYYQRYDPNVVNKVKIFNQMCYLIREVLKTLPKQITLPEALRDGNMDVNWLRQSLADGGVPYELMPNDMWIEMSLYSIIPCFLQRWKDYKINEVEDESLAPIIYDKPNDPGDGNYAFLKGEACKFSREHKGWKLYKGIYVGPTYYRSEFNDEGRNYDWCCYKNLYRAYNPKTGTVLKGQNLYDIKTGVNNFVNGW